MGFRFYAQGLGVTPPATDDAKKNYFAEMGSGSEEGSYVRLIDLGITQM